MVRNKHRAEFWSDYHEASCNRFRILTASVLLAQFFRFLLTDFKKHKKKQYCYFLCFGTNLGQSFEPIIMRLFCNRFRILMASILSVHFFLFLPRDFKKTHSKWHVSDTQYFSDTFWSPLAKIEKRELIRWKPWEFWTKCKKTHDNRFKTLPYVCSKPQKNINLYFGVSDLCLPPTNNYVHIAIWLR